MSNAPAHNAAPRALLIGLQDADHERKEAESLLEELAELATNVGMEVVVRHVVRLREPNPRFLLGTGKTEELIQEAKANQCELIVFDDELHPAQQRNWEAASGLTVIDRQEVILDIFAARARTKEARLQVELAQAEYFMPRLRRAWSHLSRQRGGGSTQRGEGETQLQLDQRMVRDRIQRLRAELTIVRKQRGVQRRQRLRVPLPTAAIVGYTNAGKSSLLNALTGAHALAADKLFATLDPMTRRRRLPSGRTLLITDTVGFVRRLPHRLVEAFKATLEEALVADFLGADKARILTVLNKIDRVDDPLRLAELKTQFPDAMLVSAHTGTGLDNLLAKVDDWVAQEATPVALLIPHSRYDLINKLHQAGAVHREQARDEGVYIEGLLPQRLLEAAKPFILSAPAHVLHAAEAAADSAVA